MSNYWNARHAQALAKVNEAQSLRTRTAYLELAEHYNAMRRFCERHGGSPAARTAA